MALVSLGSSRPGNTHPWQYPALAYGAGQNPVVASWSLWVGLTARRSPGAPSPVAPRLQMRPPPSGSARGMAGRSWEGPSTPTCRHNTGPTRAGCWGEWGGRGRAFWQGLLGDDGPKLAARPLLARASTHAARKRPLTPCLVPTPTFTHSLFFLSHPYHTSIRSSVPPHPLCSFAQSLQRAAGHLHAHAL